MIDLSIIIVSYNTKDLTVACIESIHKHTKGLDFEIIVIDNNSKDGSADALSRLKKVHLIRNKDNAGFAGANNQGMSIAKGKYIIFLNSDTELTSDVFGPSVKWMNEHSKVGVFSCALKNKDGSVQPTGGYFPSLGRIAAWMFFIDDLPLIGNMMSSYHPKDVFYNKSLSLDWVTGAFLLTRREVIDEIGMMDTDYFMYVEDVDFSYRAKHAGWGIHFSPDSSIIHYGGASSSSSYQKVNEYKGLKIFYKKHYPSWQLPVLRFILKCGALLRLVLIDGKIYKDAYIAA